MCGAHGEIVEKMCVRSLIHRTQLVPHSASRYCASAPWLPGTAAINMINNRAERTDNALKIKVIISLEFITCFTESSYNVMLLSKSWKLGLWVNWIKGWF